MTRHRSSLPGHYLLLSSATPPLHHKPPLPSNSHRELQPGSLAPSGEPEQEMEHRAEQPHCEAVSEENRTSEEAGLETMESVEDEDEVATRTVCCSQVLGFFPEGAEEIWGSRSGSTGRPERSLTSLPHMLHQGCRIAIRVKSCPVSFKICFSNHFLITGNSSGGYNFNFLI